MTPPALTLVLAACLVALGLGAAITRRHSVAPVIAGQLGGLGAIVAILTLGGSSGEWFVALAAAVTALMGLLVAALQEASVDDALVDEEGDPLKW